MQRNDEKLSQLPGQIDTCIKKHIANEEKIQKHIAQLKLKYTIYIIIQMPQNFHHVYITPSFSFFSSISIR